MKARITCIQNLIIKLARTHKKLYTMLYWFSMLALWVLLAFLDLSIKAVTYPVIYKMEKTSGVVSNWTENEIMVIVKGIPRASSRYTYIIDGVEVPVNVSDLEKYDVVILGGGVYASGIAGLGFLKKNIKFHHRSTGIF